MKKILVIAPHADDEILGVGGTMARNIAEGNEVYVCIVTHGEKPLFSDEVVSKIREETIATHEFLRITRTFFLEFPAVMLEQIPRHELNDKIMRVIQEVEPDEVYIPHAGDMQKDHQIVSEAAMVAVRPKYKHKIGAVYAYETLSETEWNIPNATNAFIPTVYRDISRFVEIKKQALSFFSTQIEPFPNPRSLEAVEALAKYRGSTIEVEGAEAFVLIRQIYLGGGIEKFYARYIKRAMDVAFSFMGLVLLSWLMLVIYLLVRIKLGKPVFYKQKRPGYKENIFCIYKFRTMTDDRDEIGNLLSDERRLTNFGKRLRRTSLDELPQLWNILKGDMSFIGPRPLLVSYIGKYTADQHRRHDVRPGLFGLASVNGRNAQSWESKFKYDIMYVDNLSLKMDVKIFLKCIKTVVRQEGINEEGKSTVSRYTGRDTE